MHGVLIRFAPPEDWWGQPLMRRFGGLETWFLQILPAAGGCTQLVRLQGEQATDAARWLETTDPPSLVLARQAGSAVVRVTSFDCPLGRLAAKAQASPHFPFVAREGQISWLILEQPGATRDMLRRLGQAGLHPSVVRSGEWSPATDELTMHQRRVLQMALDAGFYDAPRRITVTALAGRLGVSKSTLSETLITIESKVMHARRSAASPLMRPVRVKA